MAEATVLTNLHVTGTLVVDGASTQSGVTAGAGSVGTTELADAGVTLAKLADPNADETIAFFVAGAISAVGKVAGAIVGVAGTIVDIRAYLDTAPVGSAAILDVNKNGTTLYTGETGRPTVADGGHASTTTVPAVTSVAAGDRITVDVDQIGSGTAGSDLYVSVTIKRNLVS